MVYDHNEEEMDQVKEIEQEGPTVLDELPLTELMLGEQIDRLHGVAVDKGWWPRPTGDVHDNSGQGRNVMELLFLISGELTEAGEEWRSGHELDEIYEGRSGKPEGFTVELADAYIRLMDMVGGLGVKDRFLEALNRKAAYNPSRAFRHGGKRA